MPFALELLAVGVAYALPVWALPRLLASSQSSGPATGLISGMLLGLGVIPLCGSLQLSPLWITAVFWLYILVFGFVLSFIEAAVFTAGPSPIRKSDLCGAVLASGLVAGVLAGFATTNQTGSPLAAIEAHVLEVGYAALIGRIALAATAFMVIYNVVGTSTWPFVRRYYTDGSPGLRLRIPKPGVIIPLQLARGLLATLVLLPILLTCPARGFEGWALIALAVGLTSGVVPCMNAPGWPIYLRAVHAVEISIFAALQTIAWCWLFLT